MPSFCTPKPRARGPEAKRAFAAHPSTGSRVAQDGGVRHDRCGGRAGIGLRQQRVDSPDNSAAIAAAANAALVAQGKQIFRFDTFGDETKWTDTLRMHEAIAAAVDPTTALSVGLKVDAEALPPAVVQGIQNGTISLTSPATTIALLKLNAVVGLQGTVETIGGKDTLTHVGITCALCHSTVDNSFAPGIGKRLDGWPNRDLNPGAIIALSPALDAATKAVFNSWGKGKYDPRFNLDGKNGPQVIPPAYGLAGINSITSTGDGADIAYWNRYVGVTQMGGHGIVLGAAHRCQCHQWRTDRPDQLEAARIASVSAQPECTAATRRQFRSGRCRAGPARVQRRRQLQYLP